MLEFGLWRRKIYFLELNWINFSIVLLFRLAGIRVYYLTLSSSWQKESKIQKLNELGIIWLNYQHFNIKKPATYLVKANNIRKHLRLFLTKTIVFHLLKKQAMIPDCEELSLSTVVLSSLQDKIFLMAELLVYAELIESKSINNQWMWAPNDIISREILEKEGNWVNLCPKWWTSLGFVGNVLSRIYRMIISRIASMNISVDSRFSLREIQKKSVGISKDAKWSKYEIIYFPHKGIYYGYADSILNLTGELYIKDDFYSSDRRNPFYPSKILHFSLSEDPKLIRTSLEYYKENDISYDDWSDVPSVSKKQLILMSFNFIKKYLIRSGKEFDLYLLGFALYNYINIIKNIKRLDQLTNLKIVLVGYDILFPNPLALACKMKKIKTVAIQERMLPIWFLSPFIMDHYFVYGQATKEILDIRFKSLIKNKYEIGPIRLGKHYEYLENNDKYKNQLPKYKYRVLVLDTLSSNDFYQNGRCVGNNWRINIKFYQDILKLCASFPEAHFMIKGKNYDFINIPFFSDIVKDIAQTSNCTLVKDYEKWTPFTSVSVSDIAIAMHTSLGDEILALGKPVIFYDYFKFASEFFDYGPEVISFNFDDLKLKLTYFIENPDKYNQSLDSIRKKCFNISNETPKQLLHKKLIEIYHNN
jgi:hypothetical protein